MQITLRERLEQARDKSNVKWDIIEQDYVLSWILFGISQIDALKNTLVFKGGTALKKCYFDDYRFSQDLDFSVQGEYPFGDKLKGLIEEACFLSENHLQNNLVNVQFKSERYTEKSPHPGRQEAFTILARLPWHREFYTRVMVEITLEEKVLLAPVKRPILHGYDESIHTDILTYRLEEIIAEKIRAILQFAKKLFERGWGRSRVRDYYDLWRIFSSYESSINTRLLPTLMIEKCQAKDIEFTSIESLFTPKLIEIVETDWEKWLSMTVPQLPDVQVVIQELKKKLEAIFIS